MLIILTAFAFSAYALPISSIQNHQNHHDSTSVKIGNQGINAMLLNSFYLKQTSTNSHRISNLNENTRIVLDDTVTNDQGIQYKTSFQFNLFGQTVYINGYPVGHDRPQKIILLVNARKEGTAFAKAVPVTIRMYVYNKIKNGGTEVYAEIDYKKIDETKIASPMDVKEVVWSGEELRPKVRTIPAKESHIVQNSPTLDEVVDLIGNYMRTTAPPSLYQHHWCNHLSNETTNGTLIEYPKKLYCAAKRHFHSPNKMLIIGCGILLLGSIICFYIAAMVLRKLCKSDSMVRLESIVRYRKDIVENRKQREEEGFDEFGDCFMVVDDKERLLV